MLYLCSNIPRKTFYDSLGAEILKIARVTTDLGKFKLSFAMIVFRMIKQGNREILKAFLF